MNSNELTGIGFAGKSILVGLLAFPLIAGASQTEVPTLSCTTNHAEPTLSCPAGYEQLGIYMGELSRLQHAPLPHEIASSVNLPSFMTDVQMTIWTAVGHPEDGCEPGDDNDDTNVSGKENCDQTEQENEELYVDAFVMSIFVPDHGTDQWAAFGDISYGPQQAGTYDITFRHSNQSTNDEAESVTYKAIVCGIPETHRTWDKSSLEFRGSTRAQGGEVSAQICNDGEDMVAPTSWELWYARRGNPKRGSVIDSGSVGPLNSHDCMTLTAPTQGLTGNFKFRAEQAAGHPGKGVLWSD